MADDAPPEEQSPDRKGLKGPVIIGLVLLLIGAGGGFFAISQGLLPGMGAPTDAAIPSDGGTTSSGTTAQSETLPKVAFVPLDPIVVSLESAQETRFLRFSATLEVPAEHQGDVTHLLPRISDALNSFLQAIDLQMVADRDALLRMRVQMLHRVKLVVGDDRIRDVLISEFVLN